MFKLMKECKQILESSRKAIDSMIEQNLSITRCIPGGNKLNIKQALEKKRSIRKQKIHHQPL